MTEQPNVETPLPTPEDPRDSEPSSYEDSLNDKTKAHNFGKPRMKPEYDRKYHPGTDSRDNRDFYERPLGVNGMLKAFNNMPS